MCAGDGMVLVCVVVVGLVVVAPVATRKDIQYVRMAVIVTVNVIALIVMMMMMMMFLMMVLVTKHGCFVSARGCDVTLT
jgi:hypothetical protein